MAKRQPSLASIADEYSIAEAAAIAKISEHTIRRAIKTGELLAVIPRGRAPGRAGRGQGYRISAAALAAWLRPKPA